jgi:multidrug efflux system membrane fusion protein
VMLPVRISAIILSAVLLMNCSSTEARPQAGETPARQGGRGGGRGGGEGAAATPVVSARAEIKAMPVTIDAVGSAEAISTVDIRPQITGQLQQVLFEAGQDVRKGQPLFVIDRRPLESSLTQAEAIASKDEAQLKNATAQRQRAEDLLTRGILARSDYDTNVAAAAALEATLAADRAQVEQARLNLQYAQIVSPLDGRTGALNTHVGDLVRTNDALPMVTINQVTPIYVTFSVPARFLNDIRKAGSVLPVTATNQKAGVQAAQPSSRMPSMPLNAKGSVTFVDNAVDPTTATIKLKASFPNLDRELWPGLFVQVSLQLALQPHAVVVPSVALQTSQQGQYIYVVKPDQTVEMRPVTIDRQQGDETVIAKGLEGGEEIVTQGQLRLTPGARVTTGARQATTS